ncbi:hypothetical protein [Tamlana sp. I1]|uniref:hypothetical protein n=1 Tax=Tamlana sp. I1 TaxID=2762061 RepID=UPI001890A78C|nr:hypothetical protein [Tamlana sp. I1]
MAINDKKDIGKLLSKYGYSIPMSEEEVLSFEEKFKNDYELPHNWSSIDKIITNKASDTELVNFNDDKENNSIYPLSMAAREGKKITEEIRKKMNKDKRDAQN